MAKEATAEDLNVDEEITRICELAGEMLETTWHGFKRQNEEDILWAEKIGREIHEQEKVLTPSIIVKETDNKQSKNGEGLVYLPSHLERIGDNIELLIRCTRTIMQEGICFSDKAMKEIDTLFNKAVELLQGATEAIKKKDKVLAVNVKKDGKKYQDLISEYSLSHYDRLSDGACIPKASSSYLAMLDYLSDIEKHIRRMAERISD